MEKYASLVDLILCSPKRSSQGAARKSRHPTLPGQAKRMADASACCTAFDQPLTLKILQLCFDSDQNVRNTWCCHLLAWNILDILARKHLFPKIASAYSSKFDQTSEVAMDSKVPCTTHGCVLKIHYVTLRSTGWSGAGAFHLSICSTHLRSQWWGCQSGIVKHVPL